MKKLFFITFLCITSSLSMHSQEDSDKESNIKFGTSIGIDPSNAIVGGKLIDENERRNGNAIDLKGRVFGHKNNIEIGVFTELFPTIEYTSIGVDINYIKEYKKILPLQTDLQVIIGLEVNGVWRDIEDLNLPNKESFYINYGGNIRIRASDIKNTQFFFEVNLNTSYRRDIIGLWGRKALSDGFLPALFDNNSLFLSVGYIF